MSTLPAKRPPRPKSENSNDGFYGPTRLWKRLAEIAAAVDRTKSDLVVGILEEWLEGYEKRGGSK